MNSLSKIITRFDNELAINLALSINFNLYNMFFVTSSPFLLILITNFSIGTEKIIYFSVFSPKKTVFQILLLTLLL